MANNSRTGDFTSKIRKELAVEVNFICSNPNCSIQTQAPSKSRLDSRTIVGQAAHIHAASPKGARYNSNMTIQERGSKDNAIWLCNICARMIDVDADEYSADLLRDWKRNAILRTQNNLGKIVCGEHERNRHAISAVTEAIRNRTLPTYPGMELYSIRELDSARNALDDNFAVQTNIVNDSVLHIITPKKDSYIDVTFSESCDSIEFNSKLQEYIRSGSGFTLQSSGVLIKGPKIIEQSTNGDFVPLTISISDNKTNFDFSFYFKNEDDEFLLDRSTGEMTIGEEFATLKTKIFGGFISFQIVVNAANNSQCKISYDVTNEVWEGCSVLDFDGYVEAKNFINNYEKYEKFCVKIKSLEKGIVSEFFTPVNFVSEVMAMYAGWFEYIDACRYFSKIYSTEAIYLGLEADYSQAMLTILYYKLIKFRSINDLNKFSDLRFKTGSEAFGKSFIVENFVPKVNLYGTCFSVEPITIEVINFVFAGRDNDGFYWYTLDSDSEIKIR